MSLALEILTLAIGAAVMLRLLPRGGAGRHVTARSAPVQRPADLRQIEGLVWTKGSNAADVHRALRPLLREIAIARLERHGIALDRDSREARLALGDDLWELVRPERPRPEDPRGPGITLERLTALTDRLQRL